MTAISTVTGDWHYIKEGLSFIKTAKSGSVTTGSDGKATIVFTTELIGTDYTVALTCNDPGSGLGVIAYVTAKRTNGFDVITRNPVAGLAVGNRPISWVATRDYNP